MNGEREVGSVVAVRVLPGALAVIVAGPMPASPTLREYVIVPLYPESEHGFRPTPDDLRIEAAECTGVRERHYAAMWAFTPALETDIGPTQGALAPDSVRAITDAYWAEMSGGPAAAVERRGRKVSLWQRPFVRRFRAKERAIWNSLFANLRDSVEPQPAPAANVAASPGPVFASVSMRSWALRGSVLTIEITVGVQRMSATPQEPLVPGQFPHAGARANAVTPTADYGVTPAGCFA
jgi:hypothetical protein